MSTSNESFSAHHVYNDSSVAVFTASKMSKNRAFCTWGVRALLSVGGGVLVIAQNDLDTFWRQWAALPGKAD